MIAPPTIPMIRMAEPVLVKRPSPVMPMGKMAGHIGALARPSRAMKRMLV